MSAVFPQQVEPTAVGLIAGSGVFPLRFAESARRAGHRVVAVAHHGDTDPAIESLCDEVRWVHLGQLGKMVKTFKAAGVTQAAMAGGVAKTRLFGGLRPDWMALKLFPRLKKFDNDSLLLAIAGVFESEGIRIVDPAPFCPDLVARLGPYGKRRPDAAVQADILLGMKVSNAISRAEIGQTACVKGGTVVAVEALEGTDRCIRRAGEIGGKGVVVVKIAMPEQDMRFDAPCIGPGTVRTCAEIGAAALVFEAGRAVILDEAEIVSMADAAKLALVGVRADGTY
ncbi:MAG TPA: UDP-2,3-diacylglucosamine diphosphatase LpxI [Vulgatibacter sp.]